MQENGNPGTRSFEGHWIYVQNTGLRFSRLTGGSVTIEKANDNEPIDDAQQWVILAVIDAMDWVTLVTNVSHAPYEGQRWDATLRFHQGPNPFVWLGFTGAFWRVFLTDTEEVSAAITGYVTIKGPYKNLQEANEAIAHLEKEEAP